jgi:hypothetical protein
MDGLSYCYVSVMFRLQEKGILIVRNMCFTALPLYLSYRAIRIIKRIKTYFKVSKGRHFSHTFFLFAVIFKQINVGLIFLSTFAWEHARR